MYDFCRVASVVPKILPGDTEFNTAEILKGIKKAEEKRADIVVLPELSITGYSCADLFFQKALYEGVKEGIKRIIKEKSKAIIAIGAPVMIKGELYNAAVIIYNGKIRGIVPKTFLPNYNEFYEKRWFASSFDLDVDKINARELGLAEDYEICVSKNIIFNVNNETSFGVEICEDLWAPVAPSGFLSINGAEMILNLSASNEIAGKREERRELILQQSARCISGYIYTSSGEGESTTDMVFSGATIIAENGRLIYENKKKIDGDYVAVSDIDLGKIKADRLKIKGFKDSRTLFGKFEPAIYVNIDKELEGDGSLYEVKKLPFVPDKKEERLKRCMSIFSMQAEGLKKRLLVTGAKPVIGVSGGLDSTLALLVSVEAAKRLNMPTSDVWGITMPGFGTTGRTYNNSLKLMETLGISRKEIDIKEAVKKHFEDIGHDGKTPDLTFENAQARERTQVLMDFSGIVGGLLVGTGDLSELALGWCTYNADHMSMYGVNAGVPKTLIRWIIESIIEQDIFPKSREVLKDILDTPISPELLPPDADGKILQQTESIVGPYALHDFFLYYVIRYGFLPEKIYYLAKKAFGDDFSKDTILKWLKVFYRRFFTQQFKRNCQPDGVKIGSVSLSPRGDFKMPSDASFNIWLKNLEKIKD